MNNMTIFDLVTPENLVQYWTELHVNDQPLLGETLFPTIREIGLDISWLKGSTGQPVALRLSAFDSKAIRRDRKGFENYRTEMPFFKESKYIDEKMRQQLNTLIQTRNQVQINQILVKIFDDLVELVDAALVALERMRMEAVTTGTITLASNGQAYTYDFDVPTEQKTTVTKSWSDPTADIINDINKIVTDMKAKGVTITRAICNNSVVEDIKKNNNIKNQIYVLAGGSISSISSARALSYIYDETGVEIYSYDNVYVDEDGDAVKYVPDDTVVFIPDGTLGNTHIGTTPEESDLMGSPSSANVQIVNNGIAVTTHAEHDPVMVETKVSMVALPSLDRAGDIHILDTEAE